ncbi:unnamed protein product [Candida verbasci]|uniref:Uncharacterized protein n=1 Tax=Candida verbasci TaxID=1227364 RepID=A0A9W4U1V5_9ASCO|nr:unnamed protein product [Candida verbasci]
MMSDFGKYKKADLFQAMKRAGVPVVNKDTKKILLEKLESHFKSKPAQVVIIQNFLEENGSGLVEGEEITVIEDEVAAKEEIPVANDAGDDDEEEDEDDDEDDEDDDDDDDEDEDEDEGEDDEEDDDDVVIVQDDDAEDKDYQAPPPLNLKEYIVDPIITHSENLIEKFYEITDSFGFSTLETTEKIRDHLSSSVTLNNLEISFEFLIFVYNFIYIVPLNENSLIHQFFRDNIPIFNSTYPSIEISGLFNGKAITTFTIWLISAIILPSTISYFINFTSRIIEIEDDEYLFRIHTYDPFIFALAKTLIYYFVGQSSVINFSKHECFWSSLQNKILMNLGLYNTTLSSTLGSLPYIFGGVNILIALYAQFEEY